MCLFVVITEHSLPAISEITLSTFNHRPKLFICRCALVDGGHRCTLFTDQNQQFHEDSTLLISFRFCMILLVNNAVLKTREYFGSCDMPIYIQAILKALVISQILYYLCLTRSSRDCHHFYLLHLKSVTSRSG